MDGVLLAVALPCGCAPWPSHLAGSPDPTGFTDVDHLHERARGGDHHPDGLASISRRFHTVRHRHGWTLTLDPHSGMLTAQRGR